MVTVLIGSGKRRQKATTVDSPDGTGRQISKSEISE